MALPTSPNARPPRLPVTPPAKPPTEDTPEPQQVKPVAYPPIKPNRGDTRPTGPVLPTRPEPPARPAPTSPTPAVPTSPAPAAAASAGPRLPLGPAGGRPAPTTPAAPVEVDTPEDDPYLKQSTLTDGDPEVEAGEYLGGDEPADDQADDDYTRVPAGDDDPDDGYFDYDEDEDDEWDSSFDPEPVPTRVEPDPTPPVVPSSRATTPTGGVPASGAVVPRVPPVAPVTRPVVPAGGVPVSAPVGTTGGVRRDPIPSRVDKSAPSTRTSKARKNSKARLGDHSKGTKKRRSAGWRMTERDREIISFLARYKVATYEQIAQYADMHVSNVRHRLPKLENADLVAVYRGGSRINLVTATSAGMKLIGLTLPTYDPSHGSIRHALALTDLGIFFEKAGKTVVTEREIRAAWQHGQLTPRLQQAAEWHSAPVTFGNSDPNHGLFVVPPPLGKDTGLRIPDMVLAEDLADDGSPRSVAIELELTAKEPSRYRSIVSSYNARARGQFAAVVYYTPYRDVATAVDKAISEGGASDFMTVRHYTPPTDITYR